MEGESVEGALWSAALELDPVAYARLFDLHHDKVYRQALRLVVQPADAEEVVAGAFFELWRRRAAVRLVEGSVLPWLLVTTSNVARNSRRAVGRQEALVRRAATEFDEGAGARAFERIDDDVLRVDLVAALKRLKSQDVALVTMTLLDGYSVAEVAGLLGLTENAARVRLHRARVKLRALLQPPPSAGIPREESTR